MKTMATKYRTYAFNSTDNFIPECSKSYRSKKSKNSDRDNTHITKTYYKRSENQQELVFRSFECGECRLHCYTAQELFRHIDYHHSILYYFCNICEKKFSSKTNLFAHSRLHAPEKQFSCEICDEKFNFKVHLHKHMKVHADFHTCGLCSKQYYQKSALQAHKLFFHKEVKPYACPKCDKKYTFKMPLLRHLEVHHCEFKKTFPCYKCDRKFSVESNMELHQLDHIYERPVSCDVCCKKFKNRSQLEEHIRSQSDVVEDDDEINAEKLNFTVINPRYDSDDSDSEEIFSA